MKLTTFWTDQHPRPENLQVHPLPEAVDVAIVGSGYTGLNAAIELAKSGVRTAVLEEKTIGWGASSRNGGMLTPGLKAKAGSILKMYGKEKARFFWQWSLDAIDHVESIITEEDIACDWDRSGFAALMYKPSHVEGWKSYNKFLIDNFGYDKYKVVPASELHTEIGSSSYYGAVTGEHAAGFQPAKYVFGLARAAAQRGVCLVENAKVTAIRKQQGGGFEVDTPQGTTRAREVLLATNGYTTGLVPSIRHGIFPVGSYIIVTEPLSEDLQNELSPKRRMFYDSKNFLNYFRLTADGRVLFGGRNNLSTSLDLHESARLLQKRMLEVYPQLEGIPLTHTWSGKLGITFDLMPHVGRIKGVHYAYGYGGHGASIASYLGKEIGQLLAGKISSTPFAEIRHPRSVITRFDRLYLPFVAAWYRILDTIS